MRPRHKAAENLLALPVELQGSLAASMRPRHKAAENPGDDEGHEEPTTCFNEAAA